MSFEVKLKNTNQKMVYLDGVYKIENHKENVYVFYNNEDATSIESTGTILSNSGDIESYLNAEIETVKADRGDTIKELEEREWKEQEKMIEYQWENPDMQKAEAWDDVDSLEQAKSKFKRQKFGSEAEDQIDQG